MLAVDGWKKHLLAIRGLNKSSFNQYSKNLCYFSEWIHETYSHDIESCTQDEIESYLIYLYKENSNNNNTRKVKLISIKSYFKFLAYKGIIDTSPADKIPSPKVPPSRLQRLTQTEVYNIFKQVDITTPLGIRNVCILILTFFGGFRRSEVTDLNMESLICEKSNVEIDVIGKFGVYRRIDFWKGPSVFLERWLHIRMANGAQPSDPYFIGQSNRGLNDRLLPGEVNKIFQKYARLARVSRTKIHHHMGRTTHACDLRHIKGYDLFAIMGRLGHKDMNATLRYSPAGGRITKIYPNLSAYWSKFPFLWDQPE